MAVNVTTTSQNVEQETALTVLTITRNYGGQGPFVMQPNPPAAPALTYGVQLAYGTNKLILNADGSINTVVSQNQSPVGVAFTQAQVAAWMGLPITVGATATTLGAYIESLADAAVAADIAAKAALAAAQAAASTS